MNFEQKNNETKNKYTYAGFLKRFTERVIRQFKERMTTHSEDLIIPEFLFQEPRKLILVKFLLLFQLTLC